MLASVVVAAGLGILVNAFAKEHWAIVWFVDNVTHTVGQLFLRLLFMLVVPLLFSALVIGVSELDLRELGRIGGRMMGYTVAVSAIAVGIGLTLVNVVGPGRGAGDAVRALARGGSVPAPPAVEEQSAVDLIIALVPKNPIEAAANGDMIGLIFFSLLFGVALSVVKTPGAARLREMLQGLYDVMMRLIDWVLWLAPVGVGALLFTMTSRVGTELLGELAAYVGVVLAALAIHMFGVYSLSVQLLGGMSPLRFFRDIRLAMLTAFSTASSAATLPTALKVADENLKLPPQVSRFVLTAGSAMNQNGTALFEGVTVLFLAQLYGVPLGLGEQAVVMGICILGGIGTAGVPAGSIPVIAMILVMFGIPVEGLALILGVDRILDMCRTTLNVTGDLAAAVYVARGEPVEPDQSAPAPSSEPASSESEPAS
jgi:DAACS family dicarboxylate/amino acid:cation (Na+ or H+) symporter